MPDDRGFGQFCPVALASEVLTRKWSLLIVRELLAGSTRFNDIRRGVPRISSTLLKQRLAELERAQVVERQPSSRPDTRGYALTRAGLELRPVLASIGEWGQRWARDIRAEDLDPGWLVWNMRRRLAVDLMPPGRVTIELRFTDAAPRESRFWLVKQGDHVEVCLKPPGFDVDVSVATSVRVLAEVWRGIRELRREIGAARIRLEGAAALRRRFPDWLLLSVYAPIKSARVPASSWAV